MINIRAFLGLEYYTSGLDQFLIDFRKAHPRLSASQRKEKDKYERISEMRDNSHYREPHENFWEKF